jgi:hypothetical protein
MTDTPSEAAVDLERHEGSARFEEHLVVRLGGGEGFPVQATSNRLTCEREQKSGRVIVDRVLETARIHPYQDGIVTT